MTAPAATPPPVLSVVVPFLNEEDVPDNFKPYIEINRLWYKDKAAARAKVVEVHGA